MRSGKRVWLVLLLSAPGTALAQEDDSAPAAATPAVVERVEPETAKLPERIYRKGNLRVSVRCAETWASPDTGLSLTVDGRALDAKRLNGRWSFYSDVDSDGNVDSGEVWIPSDVGYLLEPGRHHVVIGAPGCTPAEFDMDAYADHTQHAEGRLAIADPSLLGPVGAPDGLGELLGVWYGAVPAGTSTDSIFHAKATLDPTGHAPGAAFSSSIERRHWALAVDMSFMRSTITGQVTQPQLGGAAPATAAFSGSRTVFANQLRIGARLPLQLVALEAGGGLGLQWWLDSTSVVGNVGNAFMTPPHGVDGSFYVPLWVGATIKPFCNWGVQLMGQYDIHPTSTANDALGLMAGVLYQPSAACSEPAGIRVAPR